MELLITHIWIVCVLSLLAGFFTFFFGHKMPLQGASITIGAMGMCFIISILVLLQIYFNPASGKDWEFIWFFSAGSPIKAGFMVDPLTAVMLVVVTLVSLLVQVYSTSYMQDDKGFTRYFSYLSVFTFAMLLLIITNNLLIMYIAWELVGLCSYLLIGFWYEKQSATDAAKKAFITTKVGDIGFLLGLLLLYAKAQTFHFSEMFDAIQMGLVGGTISPLYLAVSLILLFGGAVGKSAQFPLHVWLPDAMEGPTPVSALIHAATMVAAGVYLVGRAFPLFVLSKAAILFVAYTGAITAIFAASIALVMNDIKKVLAYSTISQLGFMMLGLGVGGYISGLFHLTTHAFFKALLFLGSGSVIHAMHSQDIRDMGGLWKPMKITAFTFLMGCLSIAGFPLFAGFFSKDAILADVFSLVYAEPVHILLLVMSLSAAFMTAFYMFRLFFMTFMGETRDHHAHPHESPLPMTVPLIILAVLAVIAGFFQPSFEKSLQNPTWIESHSIAEHPTARLEWVKPEEMHEPGEKGGMMQVPGHDPEPVEIGKKTYKFAPELHTFVKPHVSHSVHYGMMAVSTIIAFLGIGLAFLMYRSPKPVISPDLLTGNAVGAFIHKVLSNKYYFDEINDFVFVGGFKLIAQLLFWFDAMIVDGLVNACGVGSWLLAEFQFLIDKYIVDGLVNGAGTITGYVGRGFSMVQNGLVQTYIMIIATCVLGTLLVVFHTSFL